MANRSRSMATARMSATGFMCSTTAKEFAPCSPRASWARPTTSAAATSERTSTWSPPSATFSMSCGPAPTIGSRRSLITFVKDRPGHDRRYAIDATKIRRELGWAPKTSFEPGIRATVEWYLANLQLGERCSLRRLSRLARTELQGAIDGAQGDHSGRRFGDAAVSTHPLRSRSNSFRSMTSR